MDDRAFSTLIHYLSNVPAIETPIAHGSDKSGCWWVKFSIDIDHELAWQVVQELGHVLNELSLGDRLPTVFKPVSPPPYLNGGPRDFLAWVIECADSNFRPGTVAEWLEGRLPCPVQDSISMAGCRGVKALFSFKKGGFHQTLPSAYQTLQPTLTVPNDWDPLPNWQPWQVLGGQGCVALRYPLACWRRRGLAPPH